MTPWFAKSTRAAASSNWPLRGFRGGVKGSDDHQHATTADHTPGPPCDKTDRYRSVAKGLSKPRSEWMGSPFGVREDLPGAGCAGSRASGGGVASAND
jgi:hypothetical protein